jgi:hypothetical protein
MKEKIYSCLSLKYKDKEFLLEEKYLEKIKQFSKLFDITVKKVKTTDKPLSLEKMILEFCK